MYSDRFIHTTVNRYQLLKNGFQIFAPRSPIQVDLEDDPTQYERAMDDLDSVTEVYNAVMISLLNLSTLRLNQVSNSSTTLPRVIETVILRNLQKAHL